MTEKAKVFHVDWAEKKLIRIEELEEEEVEIKPLSAFSTFKSLWEKNQIILTTVDSSFSGVRIPDNIRNKGFIKLKWGKDLNITEFGFDIAGVYGNHFFKSFSYFVFLPWEAIVSCVVTK